jgi:hypothetical protein
LDRQRLVRDGVVVPDTIVLAHEEERTRLARQCPEALDVTEVVGDPMLDRIAASLPARALYREALGVGPRDTLLTVTSTWGPKSLLGQDAELLEQLVTELDDAQYKVAVQVHPNAWTAHGPWQIQAWLAKQRRGPRLTLVSQYSDPCAALVAGDYIISDHGSMGLYGTATGAPILLAGSPNAGVDPTSPGFELSGFAARLDSGKPLRRQLARATAAYRPESYRRVAGRISSYPDMFARRMRRLIYRKLRLRAPGPCPDTETAPVPIIAGARQQNGSLS